MPPQKRKPNPPIKVIGFNEPPKTEGPIRQRPPDDPDSAAVKINHFLKGLIGMETPLESKWGAGGEMAGMFSPGRALDAAGTGMAAAMHPKLANELGRLMTELMDNGPVKNAFKRVKRHLGDQFGQIKTGPVMGGKVTGYGAQETSLPYSQWLEGKNPVVSPTGQVDVFAPVQEIQRLKEMQKNPEIMNRSSLELDPERVKEGDLDFILGHELEHGRQRAGYGAETMKDMVLKYNNDPNIGYANSPLEKSANYVGGRYDQYRQRRMIPPPTDEKVPAFRSKSGMAVDVLDEMQNTSINDHLNTWGEIRSVLDDFTDKHVVKWGELLEKNNKKLPKAYGSVLGDRQPGYTKEANKEILGEEKLASLRNDPAGYVGMAKSFDDTAMMTPGEARRASEHATEKFGYPIPAAQPDEIEGIINNLSEYFTSPRFDPFPASAGPKSYTPDQFDKFLKGNYGEGDDLLDLLFDSGFPKDPPPRPGGVGTLPPAPKSGPRVRNIPIDDWDEFVKKNLSDIDTKPKDPFSPGDNWWDDDIPWDWGSMPGDEPPPPPKKPRPRKPK